MDVTFTKRTKNEYISFTKSDFVTCLVIRIDNFSLIISKNNENFIFDIDIFSEDITKTEFEDFKLGLSMLKDNLINNFGFGFYKSKIIAFQILKCNEKYAIKFNNKHVYDLSEDQYNLITAFVNMI